MKLWRLVVPMPFILLSIAPAEAAKNVIFMIGDGMGPAYLSAYRYFKAGEPDRKVTKTIFDDLMVGSAITAPDDDTWVTDSAASATALASGVKSYNGAIGVDSSQSPVNSLFVSAKTLGKTVGVVSTSHVNHATPASFVAHHSNRGDYQIIADQMALSLVEGEVDIVLGGGRKYFPAETVAQLKDNGIEVALDWEQLDEVGKTPVLGLLADVALPFAIDSERPKRLAELTNKALQLASNNSNGFNLMIEGSQIDWCGHANDIACAMAEMDDFAAAVQVAKTYVDNHPDTLLLITADHSTGGLTLGVDGKYQWRPLEIAKVHSSAEQIAKRLLDTNKTAADYQAVWNNNVDFALTPEQVRQLIGIKSNEPRQLEQAVSNLVSKRSFTGWTTSGHTAVDVPVMAYGNGANVFVGMQHNTDIPLRIMQL